MSDTKENEEAGQNVPVGVDESKQLADVQVQLEAPSVPVEVEKSSVIVENVKVEAPAGDKNLEPEASAEVTPQQEVQDSLLSVPVEADAKLLVQTDSEHTSDMRSEVKESPQINTVIESGAVVSDKIVDTAEPEIAVDIKPETSEVPDGKTGDNVDSVPTSHNEPATPQAVPADSIITEIENGLNVESKVNEEQVVTPADNGISNTKHSFLDVNYEGNDSGTEGEQSAFMKELENFFRERSMEFKPPKFYGEGLNCLK